MRKRLGIIFAVIAVLAALSYWLIYSHRRPAEEAFAGERKVTLWSSRAQVREPVVTLGFGERVEVMSRAGDDAQVRTSQGAIGWVLDAHQLLDAAVWQRANDLLAQSHKLPVQARGHTKVLSNLRLEPGRDAQRILQLARDVPLEILSRRVVDVPSSPQSEKDEDAETKREDWLFVRGQLKDLGEVAGWLVGRFIDLDLPEPLPSYTSSAAMHVVGWFELNRVADSAGSIKPQYLVVGTRGGQGQGCDFTLIRVFTWGMKRHRYETAYVESNVCGALPVLVTPAAQPGGDAAFRFTNLTPKVKEAREYRMHQTIVRRIRESEPPRKVRHHYKLSHKHIQGVEVLLLTRNGVNRVHGPHRCPVGDSRTTLSSEAAGRWARPTVAGHASRVEWCLLGFTHGRSLARSAASLSALPNLSSPLPTVAAFRAADAAAPEAGRGLTRSRETRPERVVHRCQLQFGEKRGSAVGPTRRGKGSKIMAISDGHGLPLAVHVASASPHETKLVEPTLEQCFLTEPPERLIGDRAYDSDPLDAQIRERFGVELVAPHNPTRSRKATQDGRVLRRYRRRWEIERLFAWLHNYRRVVIRWEYYPENFLGMVQLACAIILLKHL